MDAHRRLVWFWLHCGLLLGKWVGWAGGLAGGLASLPLSYIFIVDELSEESVRWDKARLLDEQRAYEELFLQRLSAV